MDISDCLLHHEIDPILDILVPVPDADDMFAQQENWNCPPELYRPVLFEQERIQCLGKMFRMLKFRTMKVNTDISVHKQHLAALIKSANNDNPELKKPMVKLDSDPRIIPLGKYLRKMCLDEIPQLINVLKGEMSLVGPRPPLAYEVEEYPQWYYGRFNTIPGMTGLWQVSGKNRLTFDEMVRLDIQYARECSFWLDTKIILKTPLAIITQIKDSLQKKIQIGGVPNYA